tara:strand:+ start:12137 stop:12397 length:261 start_codon:yes stop_codon:yes gene_type:complete
MSARLSIPQDLKPLLPQLDSGLAALIQLPVIEWKTCPRDAARYQPKFDTLAEDARRRIDVFAKIHNVSRSAVVTTALDTLKTLARV